MSVKNACRPQKIRPYHVTRYQHILEGISLKKGLSEAEQLLPCNLNIHKLDLHFQKNFLFQML